MKTDRFTSIVRVWIPLAVVTTLLCGLVYVAVQQDERQSANDPQIQLAKDAVIALEGGKSPSDVVPAQTIDITNSLAPFVIVYDAQGKPLASSGMLNGNMPTPPSGVFAYTAANAEDRVTWQPQPYTRIAAVIKQVMKDEKDPKSIIGFVLAGRSLDETDARETLLEKQVLVAWLVTLTASFLAVAVLKKD